MANAHQRQLRADVTSRPSAQAEPGRREIDSSRSGAALRQKTRPLDELPADVLSIPPDEMRRLGYWVRRLSVGVSPVFCIERPDQLHCDSS